MTISDALRDTIAMLADTSDSPRSDACELMRHCCGLDQAALIARGDQLLDPIQQSRLLASSTRRAQGEPVAYITGQRGFWTLELEVDPHTLIPRPDTETLVEHSLQHIPQDRPSRYLDLGTGSGAIALAVASERPFCEVVATDIDPAALRVAQRNAERLGLAVSFRPGSWFTALGAGPDGEQDKFDIIASNPPYIASDDHHLAVGDLRFEPQHALVSGPDGLDALRHIVIESRSWLRADGWLLVEHGYDQGPATRALFANAGYQGVRSESDLGGNARVTTGCVAAPTEQPATPQ
ncbi:MAG: peptide chain release factor N(5)-glutamine methyltransferase [Pseudomonadota bacterium]